MIENVVTRNETNTVAIVDYCPGDATRYRCVAAKVPGGAGVTWCVSFPTPHGAVYTIDEGAHLTIGYVGDKYKARNMREAEKFAEAIALVVPGVEVLR